MKLKIKDDAGSIYLRNCYKDLRYGGSISPQARAFGDKITAIQGMTIEVKTRFLWDDQFNTAPIEGISESGLRILDFDGEESIIEEVIGDVRPLRHKCAICNHCMRIEDATMNKCWWCGK